MSASHYMQCSFRDLTDEQVARIQVLWADDGWTQARLAALYHRSVSTISKACRAIPACELSRKQQRRRKEVAA